MHRRVQFSDDEDDEPYNEAGPDSPSSWEDTKITKPSSKKRRNVEKRLVSVPIADVEGSKSRGEVYPPSDSWAWRKYGQKPIKGSPYPRGYYRCSSSKGCPARKQVERSRVDPSKLLITYACDHNHPLPAASAANRAHHHHHQHRSHVVVKATKKDEADAETDRSAAAAAAAVEVSDPEPAGLDLSHVESPMFLGGCYCEPNEFGWFYDVALSDGGSICAGNLLVAAGDADAAALERELGFSMGEEDDESLFSDLGDLPDCAAVFRRGAVAAEEESRRCDFGAVPFCGGSS